MRVFFGRQGSQVKVVVRGVVVPFFLFFCSPTPNFFFPKIVKGRTKKAQIQFIYLCARGGVFEIYIYTHMLARSVHASRATTRASSFATNRCRRRRHTIERHNNGVGRRRRTFSFALAAAEDDRDGGENVEEVDDRTFIDSFDRDGSAHATSSSPPSSSTNPLPVNFSSRRSGAPRKKTQREIEAQTIEDVNGFHSPWSQYEFRVEEDDDDDTTPWEEHMKEVMGKKANWPCWDFTKPEEEYEPEPEFVSFQKPPDKYDAFEERARLYKERVKKERAQAMKEKEEQIGKFRYLSQDGDIRLKNKQTVDESEWDHEKIVELINFDPKERKRMMQSSVEVYDPRFPYDFGECPDPPEDTLDFLYNIGRLCVDDEWEDRKWIEMTGEPTPKFDDLDLDKGEQKEEVGLEEMREEKLMKAKDIGFDDEDNEEEEEEEDVIMED